MSKRERIFWVALLGGGLVVAIVVGVWGVLIDDSRVIAVAAVVLGVFGMVAGVRRLFMSVSPPK